MAAAPWVHYRREAIVARTDSRHTRGACMNRRGIGTAFGMFGAAVALIAGPTDISAQNCPPELAAAKSALSAAGPSLPDQLPRSLAGARDEISAPRGQDIQAPRGQDVQAPRGQDIQAPRTLVGSRVESSSAANLVAEEEAACKAGDITLSAQKAKAALDALR